jgi:hypothetical protein
VARGQTLESFQAVLRNAISRTEGAVHEPGAFDKAISRLLAKPVFRKDFVAYARQGLEVLPQMPDPRTRIAESLASFPKFASASPFWQRRMAAYVLDGIGHLLAPGSSANMQYVAAAAYVHIGLTADNYRRNRRASEGLPRMYDPLAAVDVIEALVHGKPEATIMKVAVRAAKVDKARTQDEARLRMTMLVTAIKGELVGPMMAILATAYSDLTREPPPAPILDDRIKEMMTEFGRLLAAMRADRSA